MLFLVFAFLIAAIILAVLGFGVMAAAAAGVVKILFYICLFLFVISLISHLARRA